MTCQNKNLVYLANLPLDVVRKLPKELDQGVYYGWANIDNGDVHKVVLSIGWNPFYDNKEKSMVSESLLYGQLNVHVKIIITSLIIHVKNYASNN